MPYYKRPLPEEYGEQYTSYVARVPTGDLGTILRSQVDGTCSRLAKIAGKMADHSYAPGKWTIKEVVGHVCDVERVMSYRALRFARADATELAGFEENDYVPAGRFGNRRLPDMLEEFQTVRSATVALFGGFPPVAWEQSGLANRAKVSVRALACIIIGHELHHRAILEERYLSGL